MTDQTAPISIETVDASALTEIDDLAGDALVFDRFSTDLLAEKLFFNPQPQQTRYAVYAARQDGMLVGFMQTVADAGAGKGWIGLFAVHEDCRRQGLGRSLLKHALDALRAAGAKDIEALAIPGNYFTPGVDPRYTPALCFLERAGFERFKDCVNLEADLSEPFGVSTDEKRLAESGIELRRAQLSDGPLLDAFFAEEFGAGWRLEAELAMRNSPPGLHLALRDGRMIAFSAHSGQNREWGFFGPMGTLPEARGTGIGRVLLLRCLNDLRDAGHQTAVIPWVGPIAFYAHHAGCRVKRVFWRYRLARNDVA